MSKSKYIKFYFIAINYINYSKPKYHTFAALYSDTLNYYLK